MSKRVIFLRIAVVILVVLSIPFCVYSLKVSDMHEMDSYAQHVDHARSVALATLPAIVFALCLLFVISHKYIDDKLIISLVALFANKLDFKKPPSGEQKYRSLTIHSPPSVSLVSVFG